MYVEQTPKQSRFVPVRDARRGGKSVAGPARRREIRTSPLLERRPLELNRSDRSDASGDASADANKDDSRRVRAVPNFIASRARSVSMPRSGSGI